MQGSTAASTSSSSTAAATIDPALFARIQPADYLARFLAEGYRPDGRTADQSRDPAINIGSISSAHGSALVRLGDTTVLCGINAEIAEPDLLAPHSGYLVPNVDLPAMCSPKYRPGPPPDEAQVLSNRIRNIALSSGIVSLQSLCIKSGKAVWVLYADIVCINDDGSVLDAALLALTAALRQTRLPKATWDEDSSEAVVLPEDADITVPLAIISTVLCASFGVSESGHLLPDPTSFEEPLCPTGVTIALDENSQIKHVWQAGPGRRKANDPTALTKECLKLARSRYKTLYELLLT